MGGRSTFPALTATKDGSTTVEPQEKLSAAMFEEVVALSFKYLFNWGYPDYVAAAIETVAGTEPEWEGLTADTELTWKQLRKLLELVDSVWLRRRVAASERTGQSLLDYLSKDDDATVVELVAGHPCAHHGTLRRLASHENAAVRLALAENPHTPIDVLLELIGDPCGDVRYSMAGNYTMTETVLARLLDDENPYVCDRAARTINHHEGGQLIAASFGADRNVKRFATK